MSKVQTPLCTLLLFMLLQEARADVWTARASMAVSRRFPAVAVVDEKLYAIGGDGTALTEEFDPVNNNWINRASMPTARWWGFVAAAAGGRIYAMGGANGGIYLDENEEFNPSTDTWVSKASMPTERHGHAVGVIDNIIYVIGGRNSSGYLSANDAYDPATDTWSTRAPMPTARYYLAAAVVNGMIYAMGGYGAGGILATVEEYNPVTDSWTSRTDMFTAREELAAAALNGKVYAIGGWNGTGDLAANEEYDPLLDSWSTRASMITARSGLAAACVGDSIYAVGGLLGFTYLNINERYYLDPTSISYPSFRARLTGPVVQLVWETTEEHDCHFYVIARKQPPETTFVERACIPATGSSPFPKRYSYADRDVEPGARYLYKLGAVRSNGETSWIGNGAVRIPSLEPTLTIVPNPVRGKASIRLSIPPTYPVKVAIYDISGKQLKQWHRSAMSAKAHTINWDGNDATSTPLAAGIYFCTASFGSANLIQKFVLVR